MGQSVDAAVIAVTSRGQAWQGERVAGVALLERTAMALHRAGMRRILVAVAADGAPAVAAQLAAAAVLRRNRVEVAVVSAPTTAQALVAAVPEAGAVVVGPAVVFDPGVAKRLAALDDRDGDVWLATAPGAVDGALAVARTADRVTAVGQGGDVAIGLARVGVGFTAAATAALAERPTASVAALLDALVRRDRVRVLEVGAALWHPASTSAERAAARTKLLRALTKPTDGLISKLINRRGSRVVTRALLDTGLTPNQMTLIAAVFGAVGIALVARGTWALVALGATLVQLQSILDGCDGELARLTFRSSRIGEWLDSIVDDGMNVAYPLALGAAAAALHGEPAWWWVGVVGAAGFATHSAVIYADIARRHGSGNPFLFRWWFQKDDAYLQQALASGSGGLNLVGFFHALGRRDLFLFAFMVCGWLGLPAVAAGWYAVIAVINGGMAVAHVAAGGLRLRR